MWFQLLSLAFFIWMFGFSNDKQEVNGFADQRADRLAMDSDSYSGGCRISLPVSSTDSLSTYVPFGQRPVRIRPRKGQGKGKGHRSGGGGSTITISTDDVPDDMPIRCAFCHEWGHHLTLCVRAFKDRLEKVQTHCAHGFHKPWFHDGVSPVLKPPVSIATQGFCLALKSSLCITFNITGIFQECR